MRIVGQWMLEQEISAIARLALDGKTLRGSGRRDGKPLQIFSAVTHHLRLTLEQVPIEEKTNEIPNFIPLLKELDPPPGTMITADAMHCQQESARYVEGFSNGVSLERSVVIAAEQGGDENWLAATVITNRFTVGRGVQVVTFEPIGDQTLGAGPVKLAARASSGLPVTFSVLNGQAAVNDQQLTLLGEGIVTVRAINPDSSLWLSASADQTFKVLPVETQHQVVIDRPKADGSFGLEIWASAGINLALETSSNLSAWTETQSIVGQGSGNPVKITLQTDPNVKSKFWRVRVR